MRSQSNVRSIAAGFLAAVLVVTLSSRPTMATTLSPSVSVDYWFSDTFGGTTVGLTTTMGGGNNNYNTEPTGGAITGAIVTIAGVKTLITVNGAAEWYCWQNNADRWYDCKAALAGQGYECLYFATTAFYTRPTCSPTGPLAGFPRPLRPCLRAVIFPAPSLPHLLCAYVAGVPTRAPTRLPTASLGYWFSDTIDGVLTGLKTSVTGGVQYDTTYGGAAITGLIATINGVKTLITVNKNGFWTCLTNSVPNWFDCKVALKPTYECQLVNTAFYTRNTTCSPTGPLAGFPRPFPPPAAPPPPCCHLPRSLSTPSPVRLRRRGADAGADGDA
jgi:hypothetical protein